MSPHDLAGTWNPEGVVIVVLVAAWACSRGRRQPGRERRWRSASLVAALAALAVAFVSPLEAAAGALASAHMVQHVLIFLVAAPLLAVSWARGAGIGHWLRPAPGWLRRPSVAWLAHVGVVWSWHASVLYEAALRHHALHALEHASFFVTGVWFWSVVVGRHASAGYGVLAVFALASQSVVFSALMTFARTPWYPTYRLTAPAFGLDPLTDQQLAGVIMWAPANAVYLAAALALLGRALGETVLAGDPLGREQTSVHASSEEDAHDCRPGTFRTL